MSSDKLQKKNPSVFLTADSVQLCSRCNEYLSVAPVTVLDNKPLCGRCPDPKAIPAIFYNNLAQHMYFPCINDRYGCNVMLAWGTAEAHEKICRIVSVVCPALTCSKKLRKDNVLDHFKTSHKELLASKWEFQVPSGNEEENSMVNKLILWKNHIFILKVNLSPSSCFCSILDWEDMDNKKIKFNLLLEDADKRLHMQMKDLPIEKYKTKTHDNSSMTKLDIPILNGALNTKTLLCTVEIEQESENMDESLLSDLECPVCLDYMRPPIFMCPAGHSICSLCKIKLTKCPLCRMLLNQNRNFALEKVTEHISFPCENRSLGCCFSGSLLSVTLHEKICSTGVVNKTKCYIDYIESCSWQGPLSEMSSHLIQKHPYLYHDLSYSIIFTLDEFTFMMVYTEYNGEIFKIYVSRETNCLQFNVELVKNDSLENKKYQFYVDFRDLGENRRLLRLTGDCPIAEHNDDNFSAYNSVIIPNRLIEPFVKNNVIECKINLAEC